MKNSAFSCCYTPADANYCRQAKTIGELFAHIPCYSTTWDDGALRRCFRDTADELGIPWDKKEFERQWEAHRKDVFDAFELDINMNL